MNVSSSSILIKEWSEIEKHRNNEKGKLGKSSYQITHFHHLVLCCGIGSVLFIWNRNFIMEQADSESDVPE